MPVVSASTATVLLGTGKTRWRAGEACPGSGVVGCADVSRVFRTQRDAHHCACCRLAKAADCGVKQSHGHRVSFYTLQDAGRVLVPFPVFACWQQRFARLVIDLGAPLCSMRADQAQRRMQADCAKLSRLAFADRLVIGVQLRGTQPA